MTAERLWWLALAALGGALVLDFTTGPSNLTVGVSVATAGLVILAAIVDGPPPRDRRRPW